MTCYSYAPAVRSIAEGLIEKHHRDLLIYGDVRIEYLFRDKAAKRSGKTVLGSARKLGGLGAFLAMPKDDAPMGDPEESEI